jgi:hypothetical protein
VGRNAIDRFVLAKLEEHGLAPSPEAEKTTMIRRVTLDLTGLPPTVEEVDAFLKDASENAYEKVVDRLLASPRYGEQMAMSWLDGARYADSHGYQADWERYQWRWRDWVIEAFNKNQPFDQFTVEQLAGDLLPNPTVEQRMATGFNRNHRMNTEGGTIAEEWRTEYVIDRVDTMGTVWLGLTLGCARCHDHKYDPVSQKEFYQLYAFFNNVPERRARAGEGGEPQAVHQGAAAGGRVEAEAVRRGDRGGGAGGAGEGAEAAGAVGEVGGESGGAQAGRGVDERRGGGEVGGGGRRAFAKRPDKSLLASKRNASTDTGTDTYTVTFKAGRGADHGDPAGGAAGRFAAGEGAGAVAERELRADRLRRAGGREAGEAGERVGRLRAGQVSGGRTRLTGIRAAPGGRFIPMAGWRTRRCSRWRHRRRATSR